MDLTKRRTDKVGNYGASSSGELYRDGTAAAGAMLRGRVKQPTMLEDTTRRSDGADQLLGGRTGLAAWC
jgi:hypothetical protein